MQTNDDCVGFLGKTSERNAPKNTRVRGCISNNHADSWLVQFGGQGDHVDASPANYYAYAPAAFTRKGKFKASSSRIVKAAACRYGVRWRMGCTHKIVKTGLSTTNAAASQLQRRLQRRARRRRRRWWLERSMTGVVGNSSSGNFVINKAAKIRDFEFSSEKNAAAFIHSFIHSHAVVSSARLGTSEGAMRVEILEKRALPSAPQSYRRCGRSSCA